MSDTNGFNWIQRFAREHPLQLGAISVSTSVFLCTCIGFFREYLLLGEFGINVATFAELNDFFVAGLKDPVVLAVLPTLGIGIIVYFSFGGQHLFVKEKPFRAVVLIVGICYPVLVTLVYIPHGVNKETDQILNIKTPVILYLRDKTTIGSKEAPLSIISTTEKYIFLYQHKVKNTIVAPTSGVSHIRFLKEFP